VAHPCYLFKEIIVVELRRLLLLHLDDMLVITQEFINPHASRAGLYRCFSRYGVNKLKDLIPADEAEAKPTKTFKSDGPGYRHIDIKYLPQMPNEMQHSYLSPLIEPLAGFTSPSTPTKPKRVQHTFFKHYIVLVQLKSKRFKLTMTANLQIVLPAKRRCRVGSIALIASVIACRLNTI